MDSERIEAAEEMWNAIAGVDMTIKPILPPFDPRPCARGVCEQPCPQWTTCNYEGRNR